MEEQKQISDSYFSSTLHYKFLDCRTCTKPADSDRVIWDQDKSWSQVLWLRYWPLLKIYKYSNPIA